MIKSKWHDSNDLTNFKHYRLKHNDHNTICHELSSISLKFSTIDWQDTLASAAVALIACQNQSVSCLPDKLKSFSPYNIWKVISYSLCSNCLSGMYAWVLGSWNRHLSVLANWISMLLLTEEVREHWASQMNMLVVLPLGYSLAWTADGDITEGLQGYWIG